jgi:hypothetical protein
MRLTTGLITNLAIPFFKGSFGPVEERLDFPTSVSSSAANLGRVTKKVENAEKSDSGSSINPLLARTRDC